MDPGLLAIIVAFIFGVFSFAILFLLFLGLRKYKTQHITLADDTYPVRNAAFCQNDMSISEVLNKVWSTSRVEVYNLCGIELYLYLSMHIYFFLFTCLLGLFGLGVLLPIYSKGDDPLDSLGIGHIVFNKQLMIAPIVFLVVFSILSYGLVYVLMKAAHKQKVGAVLAS